MSSLTKIHDVSARYGISARALRYYEDMGLIRSVRSGDYAYRLYDESALKRLEQILILRKLSVNVKDIRRVFAASGSDVVLEVLGKKVGDIDEEVALLRELKEIVLEFIRQIKDADFSDDGDVRLLYEKARDVEARLVNPEYTGGPSPARRLFEVAERLEEKAVSRLSIPDNVLKRMLENVYFIFGDGADTADELGRRHGFFVYHTCEYRSAHFQNADPRFQPGLFTLENVPDFFALDPVDAMAREGEIVRDFTPMVIMDLIRLTAAHEKVICENDIDVESIIQFVTHGVRITNNGLREDFFARYESEIRRRDISEDEKERLIRAIRPAFWKVKSKIPGETERYGIKEIIWDDDSPAGKTADMVAEYFGLSRD